MYIKSKLILEDNNWKSFLLDLVKYDENDRKIKYTITENEIKGYKTEVDCIDIYDINYFYCYWTYNKNKTNIQEKVNKKIS